MIEAIARGVQANEGLSLLWVTPLRALAADLIVQLVSCRGLGIRIRKASEELSSPTPAQLNQGNCAYFEGI